MLNIAICDDEINVRAYLKKLIQKQGNEYNIMEYASGRELIFDIRENDKVEFDIVFLDIAMDDTDGMKTAETLRQMQADNGVSAWGNLPLIIFVTGLKEHMQEAFSVSAFRYILKPVDENGFEKIFSEACAEVLRQHAIKERSDKRISVGRGVNAQVIKVKDVVYIESIGHKNLVHCSKMQLEYYGNLIDLEKELSSEFFRVHRGYLINLSRVDRYDKQDVFMDNNDAVPISRYKYQDFVRTYLEYIRM